MSKGFIKIEDIGKIDISTMFNKEDRIGIDYDIEPDVNIPVTVLDYEDEDVKKNIIKPKEKVILDNKIMIRFNYPKSLFKTFENNGGFSRIDLFRCIYEGYKELWRDKAEYLSELLIEGLYYDTNQKVVFLSIGI